MTVRTAFVAVNDGTGAGGVGPGAGVGGADGIMYASGPLWVSAAGRAGMTMAPSGGGSSLSSASVSDPTAGTGVKAGDAVRSTTSAKSGIGGLEIGPLDPLPFDGPGHDGAGGDDGGNGPDGDDPPSAAKAAATTDALA